MKSTLCDKIVNWISIAISILFGVLYILTPYYCDDLWYSIGTLGMNNGIEKMSVCWQNVLSHLQYDTGRLSNILSPPFLGLFPKWVFGMLYIISIFLILQIGRRFLPKNCWCAYFMWIAFFVLLLPWMDFMFVTMYALNYIISSFFGLVVLYAVYRIVVDKYILSTKQVLMASISAFIAGWMHEGLSLPMLCGLFVMNFFYRWKLPKSLLIIETSLLSGFIMIISFPAIWQRVNADFEGILLRPVMEIVMSCCIFDVMFILFVILFIFYIFINKMPCNLLAFSFMIIVFGMVSFFIAIKFFSGPRTFWFSQLVCGVGTFALLSNISPSVFRLRAVKVISVIALSLSFVNMGASIIEQPEFTQEYNDVVGQYKESDSGVVFYDISPARLDITLMKTSVRGLNSRVPLQMISDHYNNPNTLCILPSGLRDFSEKKATPLFVGPYELFLYDNYIIFRGDSLPFKKLSIDYTDIGEVETRFSQNPFSLDSNNYIYISPHFETVFGKHEVKDVLDSSCK